MSSSVDDLNDDNYDINDIIKSVKLEREKQLKESFESDEKKEQSLSQSPSSPLSHDNDNNNNNNIDILEWENMKTETDALARKNRNRINLLTKMLEDPILDSSSIRKACWRGIPSSMRSSIWKILLGYIPKNLNRRQSTLNRKRNEYYDLIERYYLNTNKEQRSDQENKSFIQINKDIDRMEKLFRISKIKNLLLRALYIWSLKHAATGYVQGIHDLITPFVYIFLNEWLFDNYNGNGNLSLDINYNISFEYISSDKLTKESMLNIEADSYWCLDYLIEGLQLNYVDKQPGITVMMNQLEDVIKKINISLYKHLEKCEIKFFQFSYRWMNCLLMRELSLKNIIRLWDTYLCEGVELSKGFAEFHVFVCAALLLSFTDQLMKKGFDQIILFLQSLQNVTKDWGEREIETILSEAFVYQQLFGKHKQNIF